MRPTTPRQGAILFRHARVRPVGLTAEPRGRGVFPPRRRWSSRETSAFCPAAAPPGPPGHRRNLSFSSSSPPSSSVNPEEVSHFNALASSWWDSHGPSRVLHLMNPLRHDFIRACHAASRGQDSTPASSSSSSSSSAAVAAAPPPVPPPPAAASASPSSPETQQQQQKQQLRYLDVGCGGGIFAESAARLPGTASVTAIDPSPDVLAVARQHARRDPALCGKLSYLNATVEDLEVLTTPSHHQQQQQQQQQSPKQQPLQLQPFDVVTLFEVVEHVQNPAAFLDRCGAFVRPGGWLVLSTIARTWTSWLTTNLVAEDLLRMVPEGTHDWAKYVNPGELTEHFSARSTGSQQQRWRWGKPRIVGVVYVPGLGWKEVPGSEHVGNYFFGVQRLGEGLGG